MYSIGHAQKIHLLVLGIVAGLKELVDEDYTEEMVVIAWLSLFIETDKGNGVSRHVRRLIHKSEQRLGVDEELKVRIGDMMDEMVRFLLSDEDILKST